MSNTTPESDILKPKDPSLTDDNDWPEFQLSDAEVRHPITGSLCSLLIADDRTPVIVAGKLAKRKGRSPFLRNPRIYDTLPTRISISTVRAFSYRQDSSGAVVLWAAGTAGWFELSPSRPYSPLFRLDCEAINILYFLTNTYRGLQGRKRRDLSVEDVCATYAAEPGTKCRSTDQAEEVFKRHRKFLRESMESEKEGGHWEGTSMFVFLEPEEEQIAQEDEDAIMANGDNIPAPRNPTHAQGSRDPRARHAGKGISTLRPKTEKHEGPVRGNGEDEERDLDVRSPPLAPRSSIPEKRKLSGTTAGRSMRARRGEQLESSDDDTDISSQDESDASASAEDHSIPLPPTSQPARRPDQALSPSVRIRTITKPSYEATQPGDIWTCPFDGCTKRVYAASSADSRQLIKEHFQVHAFDAQAQLDLVHAEERPDLPVGRLVDKIRMAASRAGGAADATTAAVAGADGAARPFPKPLE